MQVCSIKPPSLFYVAVYFTDLFKWILLTSVVRVRLTGRNSRTLFLSNNRFSAVEYLDPLKQYDQRFLTVHLEQPLVTDSANASHNTVQNLRSAELSRYAPGKANASQLRTCGGGLRLRFVKGICPNLLLPSAHHSLLLPMFVKSPCFCLPAQAGPRLQVLLATDAGRSNLPGRGAIGRLSVISSQSATRKMTDDISYPLQSPHLNPFSEYVWHSLEWSWTGSEKPPWRAVSTPKFAKGGR